MAHTLNYQLHQLCIENRNGPYATKANRHRHLQQIGRQLKADGYKLASPKSLKPKHIEHLVKTWQDQGLASGTIKNRMAALRWWAKQVGKQAIIPRSNDALNIPRRKMIPTESKAQKLDHTKMKEISSDAMKASLCLQAAFGLRREESLKIIPKMAHRGSQLVLKGSWCKGGRPRTVEIRTAEQRQLLEYAKTVASGGSLIPKELSYVQHMNRFEKETARVGICKVHGLRHNYAQRRYEELTGNPAPINGGLSRKEMSPAEKVLDAEARQLISRELGHERLSVVAQYIGS